jgi:hypothetical protein
LKTAGITQRFENFRHILDGLCVRGGGFDLFLLLTGCTGTIPII